MAKHTTIKSDAYETVSEQYRCSVIHVGRRLNDKNAKWSVRLTMHVFMVTSGALYSSLEEGMDVGHKIVDALHPFATKLLESSKEEE